MSTLPDNPSDLIEIALADLEKCEADSLYMISMSAWHDPSPRGCLVCLAGAVMAQSLGANAGSCVLPCNFGNESRRKLVALDYFRAGEVANAIKEMGLTPASLPKVVNVAYYDIDPGQFKHDMQVLATRLREDGL